MYSIYIYICNYLFFTWYSIVYMYIRNQTFKDASLKLQVAPRFSHTAGSHFHQPSEANQGTFTSTPFTVSCHPFRIPCISGKTHTAQLAPWTVASGRYTEDEHDAKDHKFRQLSNWRWSDLANGSWWDLRPYDGTSIIICWSIMSMLVIRIQLQQHVFHLCIGLI